MNQIDLQFSIQSVESLIRILTKIDVFRTHKPICPSIAKLSKFNRKEALKRKTTYILRQTQ